MSRRERISDFTRPVVRNKVSDSKRVITAEGRQTLTKRLPSRESLSQSKNIDIKRSISRAQPAEPRQSKSQVLRRPGLQKLPPFTPRKTKRFNYRTIGTIMAVSLIMAALPYGVFWQIQRMAFVKGAKDSHVVGDDVPRYLTSSSMMDVAAKVKAIDSIDNDKKPIDDVGYLGWYKKSSKPGKPGAMLVAGYVSGDQRQGALSGVKALKKGDYIQIETGDGRILIYRVHTIKKYKPADLNEAEILKPIESDKEGLNLLTFTDEYNQNSDFGQYRYVVFSIKE